MGLSDGMVRMRMIGVVPTLFIVRCIYSRCLLVNDMGFEIVGQLLLEKSNNEQPLERLLE